MALHTPLLDQLHEAFAVAQLHHEMKIIGIVETFEEAQQLCRETGNMGYPCLIFGVPMALVPKGAKYPQASYR